MIISLIYCTLVWWVNSDFPLKSMVAIRQTVIKCKSLFYSCVTGDKQNITKTVNYISYLSWDSRSNVLNFRYGHSSTSDIPGLISRLAFLLSPTPLFGCSSTRLSYTGGGRASLFLIYCYCSVSSEDLVVWLLIVTYIIKHVPLYMYFTLFTNTFINRSFSLSYCHSVCTHASFSLVSQHHSHS